MTTVAVDSIWVGERDRKPGDVSDLMESMTEVGLLHPIVITPDNHLVAGGRRLEAARRLGWTEIDVTAANHRVAVALAKDCKTRLHVTIPLPGMENTA